MRCNRVRDRNAVRDIMRMDTTMPASAAAAAALAAATMTGRGRNTNNGTAITAVPQVRCVNGVRDMFIGPSDQNEPEMKIYRGEIPNVVVNCAYLAPIEERLDEIIGLMKPGE